MDPRSLPGLVVGVQQVLHPLEQLDVDQRPVPARVLLVPVHHDADVVGGPFAALDQASPPATTSKRWTWPNRRLLAPPLSLGRQELLFADDAMARPHRVANGLPRALNNAATAALIAAAADGKDLVDDACAKRAAAELTRD
ncbi:MAG: hypothetical protein LC721_03500 [Actinobacteria bacterium]|nr:hypothetical protein [Actinomycetota bacterium]